MNNKTKYPIQNFYLDEETKRIIRETCAQSRTSSEATRLLWKASKFNKDEKSRELAQRELDLFIEKLAA